MEIFARTIILLICAIPGFAQFAEMEQARLDRSTKYLAENQQELALIELDAVIRFNPRNSKAFDLRGYTKMLKGDADGAVADYTTAIKLAPKAAGVEKAYNNRGIAYQIKGDSVSAFSDYEKAISIAPEYAPSYNGRGVILERRGETLLALADFNKAIELDPMLAPAYSGRAGIRFHRSEFDLALADLNKSLELDRNSPSVRLRRSFVRGMQGKWETAVGDIRTAFDLQFSAHPILGGSFNAAFLDLDKYIAANPKKARAFALRGFVELLRGRDAEADADFKKCFALDAALRSTLKEFITHVKEHRNK